MTALQCFEAVSRHLSFTRAAVELHMTQSAVSKQVAHLEEILRHRLFVRVRRRLQLTPAGALYRGEVAKILTQVEMSSRYILSYGGETEVLAVATQPTFGSRWLAPRLKDFSAAHPHIHLDVRNELEPFDLMQARVDVAFFFGHGTWPGAACVELFGEETVAVCAPGMLPDGGVADLDALIGLGLLQCPSRPEAWHEWLLAQGVHTQRSYHGPRFETFDMCIRAAQAGCGVALVPRFMVGEELREGKLAVAWDHRQPSAGAYFVAYAEHAAEVPKIRSFVQWLLALPDVGTAGTGLQAAGRMTTVQEFKE